MMLLLAGTSDRESMMVREVADTVGGAVGACLRIELGVCFLAEVAWLILGGADAGLSLILMVGLTVGLVHWSSFSWGASAAEQSSTLTGETGRWA